jgi:hypothetical protein
MRFRDRRNFCCDIGNRTHPEVLGFIHAAKATVVLAASDGDLKNQ